MIYLITQNQKKELFAGDVMLFVIKRNNRNGSWVNRLEP